MTEPERLSVNQSIKLAAELRKVFDLFAVDVAVGQLPGGGVSIRSQDENVNASNLGKVVAQDD